MTILIKKLWKYFIPTSESNFYEGTKASKLTKDKSIHIKGTTVRSSSYPQLGA